MQTAKGEARCDIDIIVLPAVVRENADCVVYYSGFSEKKTAEGQADFVHEKLDTYKYRWIASCESGKVETSDEALPKFTLPKTAKSLKSQCGFS